MAKRRRPKRLGTFKVTSTKVAEIKRVPLTLSVALTLEKKAARVKRKGLKRPRAFVTKDGTVIGA